MSFPPLVLKQKFVIIALAAVLWAPMTLFLALYGDKFSERQCAGVALVNLIASVSILIWSSRTWIQRIK
jgi:hypothetical protein